MNDMKACETSKLSFDQCKWGNSDENRAARIVNIYLPILVDWSQHAFAWRPRN